MAVFGSKNYASLVAPLKKMANDLAAYISEQTAKIEKMNTEKANILEQTRVKTEKIDDNVKVSKLEIAKSNHTSMKIQDWLAHDLDENGIPDIDELPEEPEKPDDPPATGE